MAGEIGKVVGQAAETTVGKTVKRAVKAVQEAVEPGLEAIKGLGDRVTATGRKKGAVPTSLGKTPLEMARDRGTTGEQLAGLVKGADAYTLEAIAHHPNVRGETLAQLAKSTNKDVVYQVAINHKTPAATLAELAHHPEVNIREMVAFNPSTPPEALVALSKDVPEVMRQLTGNLHTPPAALENLMAAGTRFYDDVARHPNATPDQLTRLAALAAGMDKYAGQRVLQEVAANLHTPPALLATLTGEYSYVLRLAENPNTPKATLAELAEKYKYPHSGRTVIEMLAHNPSTPPNALALLVSLADAPLMIPLAANPRTPFAALKANLPKLLDLHRVAESPLVRVDVLDLLAQHANPGVRAAVARNPNISAVYMQVLSRDPELIVRQGLLYNPSVPARLKPKL